jgi:hypothetical protein
MQEAVVPRLSAAPESVSGAEKGLNVFGACGDADSAAENCRNEIASIPVKPLAVSTDFKGTFANATEFVFDDSHPNLKVADIPIPGTGDERTLVPNHVLIAANPYTEGEPQPYHPEDPVHPMPWGRPGETVPNKIEKPNEFAKSLLTATQQAAAKIETVDDCAHGVREALNDLNTGFHINDDMMIDGEKYRWRSATQLGEYLSASGLFDVVPLNKIQNKLEDGFIVVRHWNNQLIHARGEDRGDIAVISHNGYQYNDHHEPYQPNESRYNGGYVLVPKGYVYQNEPIHFVPPKTHPHGLGHGHGHGHGLQHGHKHRH